MKHRRSKRNRNDLFLTCKTLWLLVLSLVLSACSEGVVSNKYSRLPARFKFDNIQQAAPLLHACNSPGEWCTIRVQADGRFLFANTHTSIAINRTAMMGYEGFYMGLSGFIVGLPNIPEMGTDRAVVTCYDLACSNCYADSYVARALELQESGFALCQRCQRIYNLNNTGQVQTGQSGKPLYRYRVYCAGNNLAIDNQ